MKDQEELDFLQKLFNYWLADSFRYNLYLHVQQLQNSILMLSQYEHRDPRLRWQKQNVTV